MHAASCAVAGGCAFTYALALTPVLTSVSSTSGAEGELLTVQGHALSPTLSENSVLIGGQPCEVVGSETTPFAPAPCPVLSCTQELQVLYNVTCRMPHLDSFGAHEIVISVDGKGQAPQLSGATVAYTPELRSFGPSVGSVAGGTVVSLTGDGLSSRRGDVDIRIGGVHCRVLSANVSHASCLTGAAPSTIHDTAVPIVLRVRGVQATCVPGGCQYTYSTASTPAVAAATVVSTSETTWTVRISGLRFATPAALNTIKIGRIECVPTGAGSNDANEITCTSAPPLSGAQVITIVSPDGAAQGSPTLPTIQGTALSAGSISPATSSLAGGSQLTVSGAGFSGTSTLVTVCGQPCPLVAPPGALDVKCTVPSLLVHETGARPAPAPSAARARLGLAAATRARVRRACTRRAHRRARVLARACTGRRVLNMSIATGVEHDLGYASPPPPPPGAAPIVTTTDSLTVRQGQMVALQFYGLNGTTVPRGSNLSYAALHVVPQSGARGALVVDVRVSLYCGDYGVNPLSASEIASVAGLQDNNTIEWDMQPYDIGFESDQSPDLTPLLAEALAASPANDDCSAVVYLHAKAGKGVRTFYSPASVINGSVFRLTCEPPRRRRRLSRARAACVHEARHPRGRARGGPCTR